MGEAFGEPVGELAEFPHLRLGVVLAQSGVDVLVAVVADGKGAGPGVGVHEEVVAVFRGGVVVIPVAGVGGWRAV